MQPKSMEQLIESLPLEVQPGFRAEVALPVMGLYHEAVREAVNNGVQLKFGINTDIANKAMRKALKYHPDKCESISVEMEKVTYDRRKYGRADFYTWAKHPEFNLGDPYPASRFPKSVLFFELARQLKL